MGGAGAGGGGGADPIDGNDIGGGGGANPMGGNDMGGGGGANPMDGKDMGGGGGADPIGGNDIGPPGLNIGDAPVGNAVGEEMAGRPPCDNGDVGEEGWPKPEGPNEAVAVGDVVPFFRPIFFGDEGEPGVCGRPAIAPEADRSMLNDGCIPGRDATDFDAGI